MSDNVPTITWKVTNLDCYPKYDQETDVVFTVHWDCLGNMTVATGSLSGSTYNSRVYGTTGVTYHSGSSFTPFDQLTEPQVLGWTFDSMGTSQKASYETAASNAIYTQIDPPVVSPPLPWSPVPPTITVQPVGGIVIVGSDYTFNVAATGTSPLSYQWYKNSTTITGETNTSYTIVSASLNNGGTYNAVVSNAGGVVTSNSVTLTISGSTPISGSIPI
jgi:hypothetical protein